MLKKFTDELKEHREKVGITLQNVAAKTRIDIKFLEALEEGNFSFLPEIYVKAFIKQYAKVIGLDEEETVQKYVLAKEGKKEPAEKAKHESKDGLEEVTGEQKTMPDEEYNKTSKVFADDSNNKKSDEHDKKKQKQLIIGGTVVGVVLLALIVFFTFFTGNDDIIVEEKPYEEVLQETPNRYIEEKDNQSTESLAANIAELTLTITNIDSTDSSWVLVVVDDTSKEDFLLPPNISKTIKANNNYQFILGNSGVVKLNLNGKVVEFDGKRDAVRYFKLDANGLKRIYKAPQLNNE